MINPGNALFINRDHIVSVTIREHHVIIVTADGRTTDIPVADDSTLSKFADDLANSVQSNFVSIAAEPRVIG